MLNVGNGLALLGMTTLIGEFFLTYFAKVGSLVKCWLNAGGCKEGKSFYSTNHG